MAQKFANFVSTTFAAIVNPLDVTVQVAAGQGVLFAAANGVDYLYAVMVDSLTAPTKREIVKVTNRVGDVLTVTRGQDGTIAQTFIVGNFIEVRLTRASMDDIVTASSATSLAAQLASTTDPALGDAMIGFHQGTSAGFFGTSVGRTLDAKMRENVSVFDFMTPAEIAAVEASTMAVDVTAAFNNALSSGAKRVHAPSGGYHVTGLTIPDFVTLEGDGESTLIRVFGDVFAISFAPGNRSEVRNLQIDANGVQAGGGAFDFTNMGNNVWLSDIYFGSGLFFGLHITPAAVAGIIYADRLRWNGVSNCNTAVKLGDGVNLLTDVYLSNLSGTAATDADMVTWVDQRNNTDSCVITNGIFINGGTGGNGAIVIGEVAAGNVTGSRLEHVIVDHIDNYGINVVKCLDYEINGASSIQSCANGMVLSGTVTGFKFHGGVIQNNVGWGVIVNAGASFWEYLGVTVNDNNQGNTAFPNGFEIAAGVSDWRIVACNIGNGLLTPIGHQKTGVVVAAGASDRYEISGCNFFSNETASVSDGGTGLNKLIQDTSGFLSPVRIIDGTAAAPGLCFAADPDTGILRRNAPLGMVVVLGGAGIAGATTNSNEWQVRSDGAFTFSSTATIGAVADVLLRRDAAGVLALRNAANAQALHTYNTYTDAANYERLFSGWSSGAAYIYVQAAGTGVARNLVVGTGINSSIIFTTNAVQRWAVTGAGNLAAQGAFQLQLTDGSVATPGLAFTAETNTGFARIAAQNIDAVVAGGSRLRVSATSNAGVIIASGLPLAWGTGGATTGVSSPDLFLYREAANALGLRNGGSAQTVRIFNTYADAANNEYLELGGSSIGANLFAVLSRNTGGGTARPMYVGVQGNGAIYFRTNASDRWSVATTGHLVCPLDNAYDIGVTGGNRPRNIFIAGNITIGDATALVKSSVAMNNGAAAGAGTLTNAPAAGDPTKWIPINDNGTTRYIPAW